MNRLNAEPHAGAACLALAGDLAPGDRVVYRHRGQLWAETVAEARPLTAPTGYIAVRFAGRQYDVHYPARTSLAVARPTASAAPR